MYVCNAHWSPLVLVTVFSSAEGIRWFQGTADSKESLIPRFLRGNSGGLGISGSPGITDSRGSLVPQIWECYWWVFRLCKPFFANWICVLVWKYFKPCAERPLEIVCYISWKLWNQWFPNHMSSLSKIWECYRWVFRLWKPFFVNWICVVAWKYLKLCAERPLEMVCYTLLVENWGTSDSL